jgi:tetratricopeptide (TPR) repeat protein
VLIDAHLLQEDGSARYRFHDLLREYAAECVEHDETDDDRAVAVRRLLSWYVETARAAARILDEQRLTLPKSTGERKGLFTTYTHALTWFLIESENLVAATRQAEQLGEHSTAYRLAAEIASFLQVHMNFEMQATVDTIGLAAARRIGDRRGEAHMLAGLGIFANYRGNSREALDYLEQALTIWRDLGDVDAMDMVNLGSAYGSVGRHDEAIDHLRQGLTLARKTGNHGAEGHALECLAQASLDLHRINEAIPFAEQALTVFRNSGLSYGEGIALNRLADAYLELDEFDQAISYGEQSLAIRTKLGDRLGQAWSLDTVAKALQRTGQAEAANQCWRRALSILEDVGRDDEAARVRTLLSASADEVTD